MPRLRLRHREAAFGNKETILATVRIEKKMAKVTSKYQVTLPKAIAEQYGIRAGDDIAWVPAGDVIRVLPPGKMDAPADLDFRLRLFDEATERQRLRSRRRKVRRSEDRGWTREDLYARGRSR